MFGASSSQASKKAVAYYRHSAEDKQENSVAIQRSHTQKFAEKHNIQIIHEEADEGKSGLLADRPAFQRLFSEWIKNPDAPHFDYILVYDVSRWGRFQNPDEAAHYTFVCENFGKEVVYVSLGFPDSEKSLLSGLGITLERYMASEYSRQLSSKVFFGAVKVAEQGYSAGGTAAYGMVRELLDVHKKPIRILEPGEHKQIANERVVFAPKNDETTETVRKIFNLFVEEKWHIKKIASYLNQNKIQSANGKLWDRSKIIKILSNEIYIGTHIYNKRWGKLKKKCHTNPRSEWVVVPNAFRPVVEKEIFDSAQERLYFLLPSNWKKGEYAIKKAKKFVRSEIISWLEQKGCDPYKADKIFSELPIIFAVKNEGKFFAQWCFIVPEQARKFESVLAMSVLPDDKKNLGDLFHIPIHLFTKTNFLIFSNNSSVFYKYKIDDTAVDGILSEFL